MKVVDIGRLVTISDSSKVKFTVLVCILTCVTSMVRNVKVYSALELLINCSSCPLRKRFTVNVFGLDVRNETLIAWNMLGLNILGRPSDPVLSLLRVVGELNLEILLILLGHIRVKGSLCVGDWSATGHQGTIGIIGRFTRLMDDDTVGLSGSLTEDLHLLRDVASVAWEILLLVIDFLCHILIK
jgi:hypothetical protein